MYAPLCDQGRPPLCWVNRLVGFSLVLITKWLSSSSCKSSIPLLESISPCFNNQQFARFSSFRGSETHLNRRVLLDQKANRLFRFFLPSSNTIKHSSSIRLRFFSYLTLINQSIDTRCNPSTTTSMSTKMTNPS